MTKYDEKKRNLLLHLRQTVLTITALELISGAITIFCLICVVIMFFIHETLIGGTFAIMLTVIHFNVAEKTLKGYYDEEISTIKKLHSMGIKHPSFKDL
jgi:hypothetical protein